MLACSSRCRLRAAASASRWMRALSTDTTTSSMHPNISLEYTPADRNRDERLRLVREKYIAELRRETVPQDYQSMEEETDWIEMQKVREIRTKLTQVMSQYGSTVHKDTKFRHGDPLHKPKDATLSALVASGAHFGHAKTLMNPNFMPYAYGTRGDITMIDLEQTLPMLRRAAQLVRSIAAADGSIIFIGTRPDLRPVVQKAAERVGNTGYYVGERWLPGTLTNKLQMFGPDVVQENQVIPDLVILLNPIPNINAIRECAIHHVPTIGIIDSNVDPRIVMYPIPANDESTRTAELIAGVLSIAGREGVAIRDAQRLGEEHAKWAAES